MVTLHGHFIKMKNKKDAILIIILVIILAIILFSYPKPQLSPPCGDCTPWINGTCGATGCQPLEIKQGRTCTGELPHPQEVIFDEEEFPLRSPINPACIKRCVPAPDFCNHPPGIPFDESPQNNSENTSRSITLSWNSTDSDNGTITYDIYFGNETILEEFSLDHSENSIELADLDPNSTYLWQVIAKDDYNQTEGPIWRFTTGDPIIVIPPNPPGGGSGDDDDDDETCTEDELNCIDGSIMICEDNKWVLEEACQNGCIFDECIILENETTIEIKISTNTDSNEIYQTNQLDFSILLESSKNQARITLTCALEDLEKNKISTTEETLTINLENDLQRQLPVPEILPSGEYILSCEVTHEGKTIATKKTITFLKDRPIEEPKAINIWSLIIYSILFLLLLAIIIIFIKKKRKTKKGGKKVGNRSSKTTKATRRKHKKSRKRNKNVLR
jgi:hypothetical protein